MNFRQAAPHDILFISRGFHAAMLLENAKEERIREFAERICVREDTLYSWKNTIIAEDDGVPVGMITAYDGLLYHAMKVRTFTLVKEMWGIDNLGMDDEALPGEYYIDSLSVIPEQQGRGVGKALIREAIEKASMLGIDSVTIVVDPINKRAQKLYESLGFKRTIDVFIFGHDYWKMSRKSITE